MYEERLYRKLFKGINLEFFNVCVLETDLTIGANTNLYEAALASVSKYRKQLEQYIQLHPMFLTSLEPVEAEPGAPGIVLKMCEAAQKAGVGPMAAVAGAISELVGLELLNYSDEVIVENGGDIFIKTKMNRRVGVYAGNSPFSEKLAVVIEADRTPLGICTSAGTVGHSLSFGKVDAAMILSKDTFLADAVATATGNIVKTPEDIEKALEFAMGIEGIEGALVIIGDKMGAKGNIRLVRI
ncbi:MAG: UPF0280 family protein [Clostridia bacterium]|nr:UPF0280 family protein [Clostridia bacterium]